MLLVRIAFAAIVMVVVIWSLSTGKPLGGLVLVPLFAILLRRAAGQVVCRGLTARAEALVVASAGHGEAQPAELRPGGGSHRG